MIGKNRRLFENQSGIKTVRKNIGFSKFIWKLKSRNLFGNWSLENYLKIGVLGIKFKNWIFGN